MFKRKSAKDKPAKPKKSKKAKAAKPAKAKKEKTPRVKSDIVVQKPDTDVYTVMLVIAFISILTACLLLYIELSRYGSYPWWK
ncbi:MAG: hypothetical protein KDB27_21815 [Planctomycetales bacterium]|nr:hypothetical protein [Planctomycetales bacterium]